MNFFTVPATTLKYLMKLWPPLWFTGIRFEAISKDFRYIRVAMPLRFYNKNVHGLQFGGSLYSMTDPCHVMMIQRNLGPAYRVLDRSASIEFIKPGLNKVTAECRITKDDLQEIYQHTHDGDKYFKDFIIEVFDEDDVLIAKIVKTIYVRKKR